MVVLEFGRQTPRRGGRRPNQQVPGKNPHMYRYRKRKGGKHQDENRSCSIYCLPTGFFPIGLQCLALAGTKGLLLSLLLFCF